MKKKFSKILGLALALAMVMAMLSACGGGGGGDKPADGKDSDGGSGGEGGGKGKNSAPDKKVNEAVDASKNAESEREAVDDGLIKAEAAKK